MVTERGLAVLRAIVQDYITSSEPVGSKSIVERHAFGVSAATIRNDMALLEEEELIAAPHTSSGRVPTDKGYRVFVDRISELSPLSVGQRAAIEQFLQGADDIDETLHRTVRLLSQLTNQVAMVQYPSLSRARVQHIEFVGLGTNRLLMVLITDGGQVEQRSLDIDTDLSEELLGELRARVNTALVGVTVADAATRLDRIPEHFAPERRTLVEQLIGTLREQLDAHRQDRLLVAGSANLARTEQDFSGSIYPVLEAIEEQVVLLRLFAEMEADSRGIASRIGRENESFGLTEATVLSSEYRGPGGGLSRLGVLGPTRMDYPGNMAAVRAVARYVSQLLGDD